MVGYVDPQYSLVIALIVMLVLIGWRSRAEIARRRTRRTLQSSARACRGPRRFASD